MGGLPGQKRAHDIIIVGAGLSGICSLHHIRKRFPSWNVTLLEAAAGPGGTWYWNRYPGARFDSESVSYGFSFDKEILDEWHWKEAFSPQAETLKYIDYVVDKHDLRRDMQFNTYISSVHWQDDSRTWKLQDKEGNTYETRFFVSCLGFLSAPTLPNISGIENFTGQGFHTSRWPKDCVPSRDFAGKRVGVIGTGATGIQTITALSKIPEIKSLHVFQRTANWSAPLRNTEISPEQMQDVRKDYDNIFQRCLETSSCFLHQADARKSSQVTPEERLAHWEKIYSEPGFAKWLGAFSDTYTDREANALYSAFHAQKIRDRINDPATADSLIPKNHGFGTRRVPLESGYFEAYNQPNVHLVDLQKSPIKQFTADGIQTEDDSFYPVDIMIYATGFNAITGAFSAVDFRGKDNKPLIGPYGSKQEENAIWEGFQPKTYLGLTVPAMPNFFMVLGPHQPFGNATRSIEHATQVVCELLQYCNDNNLTYVEPKPEAVEEWTDHVIESSKGSLVNEVDSWMTGVNKNVNGKTVRTAARYAGNAVEYRKRCDDCRAQGWTGLTFA